MRPAPWPRAHRAARASWRSAARGAAGDREPRRRASEWRRCTARMPTSTRSRGIPAATGRRRCLARGAPLLRERARARCAACHAARMRRRRRRPMPQAASASGKPFHARTRAGDANGASSLTARTIVRRRWIRRCAATEIRATRRAQTAGRTETAISAPRSARATGARRRHCRAPSRQTCTRPRSSSTIATDDRPAP